MKKIELKNLAPYLPYGLKIHESVVGKNLRMVGCSYTHELRIRLTDGLYSCTGNNLKPILRPLSDLIKEIEHNGEKDILPCEYWELEVNGKKYYDELCNMAKYNYCDGYLPYFIQLKLIEWHFDVFGLIEKGLAIDINTI